MNDIVNRLTEFYLAKIVSIDDILRLIANLETSVEPLTSRESRLEKRINYWKEHYENSLNIEYLFEVVAELGAVDDDIHVYACTGELVESIYGTFNEAFLELTSTYSEGVVLKHEPWGYGEKENEEITIYAQPEMRYR